MNPDIKVVQASSSAFEAVDGTNSQFFIRGAVVGGLLRFTIIATLPGGQKGAVSGIEFFDTMMAHFLPQVTTIEGRWIAGIDMDTNIEQFNYWTGPRGGNCSDADAAKKTWTGMRAAAYGFDKASVILKDPPRAPGNYFEVIVHFTK